MFKTVNSSKWGFVWCAALLLLLGSVLFAVDPANPPASMRVTVDKSGQTRTFSLDRYDMRGTDFEIVLLGTDGVTQTAIDPGPVRTYRGWCEEEPDSYVEATLLSNGDLRYHVFKGLDDDWWYDPPFETDENASAVNNFTEIGGTPVQPSGTTYFGASFTASAATLSAFYQDVYQATVGFDLTVEYVNGVNYASWQTYARKAENVLGHYNAIYPRDALQEWRLGKVVIRQSQTGLDYSDPQWGLKWWDINTYWETLFPNVDHNYVGFVGAVGGGVAFVCDYGGTDWAARSYNGWNGDGNWWHVARHEMGHNSGASDCVEGCPGPDGSTVMSGNNISLSRFSNPEIDQIMGCRSGRYTYLSYVGPYSFPVQPYGNLDDGITAYIGEVLYLDVLGNDYDANGDTIALAGFDATTSLGGTIDFSAGTGPDGRDELVYASPNNTIGMDTFQYTIVDSTGRTAKANVRVNLDIADTLKGYWPLDETTGTSADDLSVFNHNGVLEGGVTFDSDSVTGQFGNALSLDGTDDHLRIWGVEANSNTVTITAWVKTNGTPSGWNGIVFNRNDNAAGINFRSGAEIGYHWDGSGSTYNWSSGLVVPNGTWTFVALVVEPTKATMYMNSGGSTQSAVNNLTHSSQSFGGNTYIGTDPAQSGRHLNGSVDDVRIYNYAMSAADIENIIAGGTAECPEPIDYATGIRVGTLSWAPSAAAVSYDVYVGTNQTAVANADTASAEYQGSVAENTTFYDVQPATTYYWRVDTVTAGGTIPGAVWTFTTADAVIEPGLIAHWKLDDGSGATAFDSGLSESDGTLNGPVWTDGLDNGALQFDGVDDSVTFGTGPSLSGKTDFTLSAWVKTTSATDQVVVQQRNGGFNGQYAMRVAASGGVYFFVYGNSAYQFSFTTTQTVNDGQWHFISAVRDGENGYIYIDGVTSPAASASGTVCDLADYIGVGIGRDIRDNNRPFNGAIDDVRIYNVAKTGTELQTLYNSYFAGPDTDPPTPNPATFASAPSADSDTAISMTATTGTDASGPVEYLFTETSGNPGGTSSGWQTSSSYTDSGLTASTQYTYTVTMRDSLGNTGTASAPASATTGDGTPPAAPTGLGATAGDGSVALNWDDNSEGDLDSYTVYRSTTSGSGYAAIATDVASSDYTDNTAGNGTTYYYVVTATDTSSNESAYSNEAAATPQGTTVEMYVNDIAMGYRNAGRNYWGQATVHIKDDTGANVSGAVVYGTWSGAYSGTTSGSTLADGTVFFETADKVKNGGTFTFTVTDVVLSGKTYNPTLNVETSDSITAP